MYIDLNVSFSSGSNEYVYVEDAKDIIKSLERFFNTRQGSVPFNRSYGSSLWTLLFENQDIQTYQIAMLIYQEIQAYEPRIKLSPADISVYQNGEHSFEVEAIFKVPSLDGVIGQVTSTITE